MEWLPPAAVDRRAHFVGAAHADAAWDEQVHPGVLDDRGPREILDLDRQDACVRPFTNAESHVV